MNPWFNIKHLFEADDGSLPDIYIENLSKAEIVDVYEWLMRRCEVAGDPKLWSLESQQEISIREVLYPARAFVEGRVESFRHRLVGLTINGVTLPELSVCVEPDGLALDYRKGNKWAETTVLALFELLRQMQQRVPKSLVVQTDEGCYPRSNIEFSDAFADYVRAASAA